MKTIIFVHGMFQNDKSWKHWISFFEQFGYNCIAPAWPHHEGEPAELRAHIPDELGDLRLEEVISKIESVIQSLPDKPIVIGHSVGGLITQVLANRNLISHGIAIATVAPNRMLTLDWDFFKNAVQITNPFKGDQPIKQTAESFHAGFCNTLDERAASLAFEKTAVHDSRNVLRDCMMKDGEVDLDSPHVPLLFIGAEKDKIIPDQLVEKNSKAYKDENSVAVFKEFMGRSHYICGEPGWEEVARYIADWLEALDKKEPSAPTRSSVPA